MSKNIRVMVVDDHSILREGLCEILSREEDITVVASGSNGREAIDLVHVHSPDVVLLDIDMPIMDGITAARQIKEEFPDTELIILSMHEDEKNIFEAIKAGATGYILKDIDREELIRSIRVASTGESLIDPCIARKLLDKFVHISKGSNTPEAEEKLILSKREVEVIKLVAEGNSNLEISKKLFISDKTVKAHMRSIFKKLEVTDRAQAVFKATQIGLIGLK